MMHWHYFNNGKDCPYDEEGCMFKHKPSKTCRYESQCSNKLCQFQQTEETNEANPNTRSEIREPLNYLNCGKCAYLAKTETDLIEHLDFIHDEWKVTEYLFNYYCKTRTYHHICLSPTRV
jgi:hypothetical protein